MYGLNNGIPVSLKSIPSFGIAPQNQLTAAIQTLFWDGSQGWWFDNDDPSTMFQNSAGTTPVTAVEQFVGLQLDKSKGLVLGPELVTNGDGSSTTGWSTFGTVTSFTSVSGAFQIQTPNSTGSEGVRQILSGLVAGKTYFVSVSLRIVNTPVSLQTASLRWANGNVTGGFTTLLPTTSASTVTLSGVFSPSGTTVTIALINGGLSAIGGGPFITEFDNISVRELPGNHRFQTTSGSRPRWSKRVNLLEKTEQFNNAYWAKTRTSVTANATTAPDGMFTGNAFFDQAGSGAQPSVQRAVTTTAALHTFSVYVKYLNKQWVRLTTSLFGFGTTYFDIQNGVIGNINANHTAAISPVDNGWYRISITINATAASNTFYIEGAGGDGVASYTPVAGDGYYIWGADLRPANQATGTIPLYQRVNTSSDYDTNGFPGYLAADGSDDWMQTNSIDFSGTDKVTLCAGLRKLSDSALGVVTELSAAIASNNGTFALEAPAGASPSFNFASKGTTLANNTAQQFIAPITQTVTGIGDIAAAKNTIRVGGVDSGVNPASQGTGNYGNFPVYFFRRGGTANAFNGYEYSSIAVGKLLTASQLASLEQYTTQKTINPTGVTYANQAGFSWNSAASPPNSTTYTGSRFITPIHERMRRCLLLDNGTVNYYLDPNDSTKKADGTAADLTGADGQVMVEIPAFYSRRTVVGTVTTWEISSTPATGFTLHPAFTKDGVDVPYRYYGAYDACVYDNSTSTYISGLNWDNNVSPNGVAVDTAADKLASVSGIYPMVGLTRAEFRTIAANRGSGWRQVDWTLWSAVQLLYLIEYQSFYSQNILGAGNTNGSYLASSGSQSDSPHTIAGASNSLGNISTNTTTGAGVDAKPGTSFMCYRGIENFYGNAWNWADGIIVNPDGTASANQGDWWFTNNSADFSDSVRTNMTQITNGAATASGFASAIASSDHFFVGTSTSGGSSTTFLTDQLFASTSADRVVLVGGNAVDGASAGAFCVDAFSAASIRSRSRGARLAF
jgi:hypothetical protein